MMGFPSCTSCALHFSSVGNEWQKKQALIYKTWIMAWREKQTERGTPLSLNVFQFTLLYLDNNASVSDKKSSRASMNSKWNAVTKTIKKTLVKKTDDATILRLGRRFIDRLWESASSPSSGSGSHWQIYWIQSECTSPLSWTIILGKAT